MRLWPDQRGRRRGSGLPDLRRRLDRDGGSGWKCLRQAGLGPNHQLKAGCDIDVLLDVPTGADFDLYLYSAVPSDTGTPVILASSTLVDKGRTSRCITRRPRMERPCWWSSGSRAREPSL